jgi:Uma2 family endonuclease
LRYLVADIAYVSYERLPRDCDEEADEPHVAPDVAFEVLAPAGDRTERVDRKIDVYLRGGSSLVVVIDPARRSVRAFDRDGERQFGERETFAHAALPGFALDLSGFFAELDG